MNDIRFGDITPVKYYLGDTEIEAIYFGDTQLYQKQV